MVADGQTDSGGDRRLSAAARHPAPPREHTAPPREHPGPRREHATALREHLPGLEPERRVSDWGRSELIDGALDRGLYDFLYHYWFRVEVEGVHHVPAEGPALLVANRAGALPADAAMIVKAVRERPGHPRATQIVTDRPLGASPGIDMLMVKAGAVGAHPANLHRLLHDEGQLVLAFPEAGPVHGLRRRYRLAPFDRLGSIAAALHCGAPIVPVAVLGGEEASPVLGRVRHLAVSTVLPLPAKITLRFLPAIRLQPGDLADPRPGDPADPQARDPAGPHPGGASDAHVLDRAEALAGDLRALIQHNLLELVGRRRSVWLG